MESVALNILKHNILRTHLQDDADTDIQLKDIKLNKCKQA